ncbi:hypothetical protein NM688_g4156 [Phlebia brevispora]|uniref:Uncharacterized protein n=1 Tax=Phlebia brevispora TaxID=194682 RepID=A0ACC1T450_9APHY|nr:hypothetical protein NM688_g4156 [Phlebia brevispora]
MFRVGPSSVTFRCAFTGRKYTLYQSKQGLCNKWNSRVGIGSTQLEIRTVGYDDVKQRTKKTAPHVHVIDVREPHEVAEGHIPSAKNIPLSILKDSLHLEPDVFKEKVGLDKPHAHHEIVFYCRSGKRAAAACEVALKNGYKNRGVACPLFRASICTLNVLTLAAVPRITLRVDQHRPVCIGLGSSRAAHTMLPRHFIRLTRHSARLASRTAAARFPTSLLNISSYTVSISASCPRRYYATPPPQYVINNEISLEKYHAYSDETMESLLDSLEDLLDDIADPEYEVEYSSGVLTLKLGGNGTYVINKQPPNKQIWLSSPISGPKRYDYITRDKKWVYSREKRSLGEMMNSELSKILKRDVDLHVDHLPSA